MTTAIKISNVSNPAAEGEDEKHIIVVKDNGKVIHHLKPGDNFAGHLFAGRTIECVEITDEDTELPSLQQPYEPKAKVDPVNRPKE